MNQKNVLSIDYEDNVIQRMKERGETGVQYQVKDCTKLEAQVDKDSFDFVLDKGTFDALCSDTKKQTKELVKSYLNGIEHALTSTGSFLCVSLLQDFVLADLLAYYMP